MFKIRDSDTPTSQDLTTIANVESMLCLKKELMSRLRKRIKELK